MTEHEQKYEILAQKIGINALRLLMPVPPNVMAKRLAEDENLNNIGLATLDRAAGYLSGLHGNGPVRLSFAAPWVSGSANGLSLAERVCTLKHVAKFHYAKRED